MTPAQPLSIRVPGAKAIVRCPLCQRLMLRSEQACATCGAPASPERGGSEPDADETAAELRQLS